MTAVWWKSASGVVPGLLTESTRVGQQHLSGLSWHLVQYGFGEISSRG